MLVLMRMPWRRRCMVFLSGRSMLKGVLRLLWIRCTATIVATRSCKKNNSRSATATASRSEGSFWRPAMTAMTKRLRT